MCDQLRLHRHEASGQERLPRSSKPCLPAVKTTSKNRSWLQCDVLLEDQRTYCSVKPGVHGCILSTSQFSFAGGIFGNRSCGFLQGWNIPASIYLGYVDTIQMWYGDKTVTQQGSENPAQTSQNRPRAPTLQSGDWYKDYNLNMSKINQQIQTTLNIFACFTQDQQLK